jgi:hypothetical protein
VRGDVRVRVHVERGRFVVKTVPGMLGYRKDEERAVQLCKCVSLNQSSG